MDGLCNMHGREHTCIQRFGGENFSERVHLEDTGVDRRIVLRWIFRRWDVGAGTGLSCSG
jgi:hypothetical protein